MSRETGRTKECGRESDNEYKEERERERTTPPLKRTYEWVRQLPVVVKERDKNSSERETTSEEDSA